MDIRRESAENAAQLRTEITNSIATLGATLNTGLAEFRADNKSSADALATNVRLQLEGITQRLIGFASEASASQSASRESLNSKLSELGNSSAANLDRKNSRDGRGESDDKLNNDNAGRA